MRNSVLAAIITFLVGMIIVLGLLAMPFMFRGGDTLEGKVKMISNGKVVADYEYYDRQRMSDNGWRIWLKDGSTIDIQGDLIFEEIK